MEIRPLAEHALDPACLARLRATLVTEDSYQGILRDFLASSAPLGGRVEAALAGQPVPDLGRAVHTLKSMARLLGAERLAEACRLVEVSCLAGKRVPAAMLRAVLDHLQQAREGVRSLLR